MDARRESAPRRPPGAAPAAGGTDGLWRAARRELRARRTPLPLTGEAGRFACARAAADGAFPSGWVVVTLDGVEPGPPARLRFARDPTRLDEADDPVSTWIGDHVRLLRGGRTLAYLPGDLVGLTLEVDEGAPADAPRLTVAPLGPLARLAYACRGARDREAGRSRLAILARLVATLIRDGAGSLEADWRHGWRVAALAGGHMPVDPEAATLPPRLEPYEAWLRVNNFGEAERAALAERLGRAEGLPLIAVVMPVYDPPLDFLERAIASVMGQVYGNWRLCLYDDAGRDPQVAERLAAWAARDPRIAYRRGEANLGISGAGNRAAAMAAEAGAAFLAFLDHDDELAPAALGEVALALTADPAIDLLYSDDDKIDRHGRRFDPQFKPDWSPTLLLSYMYLSHMLVLRRSVFEAVGGFREGFEGSQDHDLALRATERIEAAGRRIAHLPRVLYHWRVLPGSTALSGDAKPASFEAGRRAVAEALARRGVAGAAAHPGWAVAARVGMFELRFPADGGPDAPSVAIVIPTRNRAGLLRRCLDSLAATTHRRFRVVVVDDASDEPETLALLATVPERGEGWQVLRLERPDRRVSVARLINRAAEAVDSDYLLLLSDDATVETPEWLSQMVGLARLPGVGAVGARLLLPDRTVQHAGIVHGCDDGMAGPALRGLGEHEFGYLGYARVARDCLAVTAACMLTPRHLFLEAGGFDEAAFAVSCNDIDYCYRLAGRGLRSVFCPTAVLVQHGRAGRGRDTDPREAAAFRRRWGDQVDPYYNPNLSLSGARFRVAARRVPRQGSAAHPVRALMVTHNLNHEGAPNSQFEVTLGLVRRGVLDPVVYSPADGPLRQGYEAAGIPVIVEEHVLTGVEDLAGLDAAIARLAGRMHEIGAEVVYANTAESWYAIAAAEAAGLPALFNIRESASWQAYYRFLAGSLRTRAYAAFGHPYRVIFVANATEEAWRPLETTGNFTTIHNGLDPDRLRAKSTAWRREAMRRALGIGDSEVALLLLGTVCERKGQLDLARALGLLPPEAAARCRVLFVGDRPSAYSATLHAEVAALPAALAGRVRIVPENEEPGLYYAVADVFVCCSRLESYPRVILEALASRLPIVTTPVFGIAEQVREGVNALFYEPGDVPGLARALARIVADAALRKRFADNAVATLECLTSYEEMLDKYTSCFVEARETGAPARRAAAVLRPATPRVEAAD